MDIVSLLMQYKAGTSIRIIKELLHLLCYIFRILWS
nr:hypothetical protein TDPV-317 [Oriental turtle dovepox virus]